MISSNIPISCGVCDTRLFTVVKPSMIVANNVSDGFVIKAGLGEGTVGNTSGDDRTGPVLL